MPFYPLACEGCNCYFSVSAIFRPFPPLTAQKMEISKKWKKSLEISSFYTIATKIMIISYTFPAIWHMTDVIFFSLGYFLPFYTKARMSSLRKPRFADWICLFADHFKQFLWNSWIKTFLLLEFLSSGKSQSFCLHFKLDKWLISYSKKLNSTLFSCNGGLQRSPIPSNCWNFSLNLQGSLLKR